MVRMELGVRDIAREYRSDPRNYSFVDATRDIAKRNNVGESYVRGLLLSEESDVLLGNLSPRVNLLDRYNNGKATVSEIAEEFGVSQYRVYKTLRELESRGEEINWRKRKAVKTMDVNKMIVQVLKGKNLSDVRPTSIEYFPIGENDRPDIRKTVEILVARGNPRSYFDRKEAAEYAKNVEPLFRFPHINRTRSVAAGLAAIIGIASFIGLRSYIFRQEDSIESMSDNHFVQTDTGK